MSRRRASVRSRTTAAAVLVVALVLVLGATAVVLTLRAVLTDGVSSAAEQRASDVVAGIEADGLRSERLQDADDEVLLVVGPDGDVRHAYEDEDEARELARRFATEDDDLDDERVDLDGEAHVLVVEDATVAGTGDEVEVVLARSLEDVTEPVSTLALLFAAGVPVALVLIGATTWVVVGRALRPVERIRAEAASIDGARLDRRVPEPESGDEIGRLARTMNLMLDRLETSARRQRQLVSDTSHELRSPIASIRQSAEIATAHPDALPAEELTATVLAESVRMQGIVDDLLLLARADERDLRLRSADVDLDDLVYAETRRLRPLPVEADASVEPARTTGDATALARVLRNLVDNAVRHAGSAVRLELAVRDGRAVIAVEDDGPGVPEPDRRRVFERFVRLDDARAREDGASGLGLAIVQEIVAAHEGEVRVVDAGLGGARFEVDLPLAP